MRIFEILFQGLGTAVVMALFAWLVATWKSRKRNAAGVKELSLGSQVFTSPATSRSADTRKVALVGQSARKGATRRKWFALVVGVLGGLVSLLVTEIFDLHVLSFAKRKSEPARVDDAIPSRKPYNDSESPPRPSIHEATSISPSPTVHRRNGTFVVNQQCNNDPFAVLRSVTITDAETVLRIRVAFQGPHNSRHQMGIYRPGDRRAFYLQSAENNARFPLVAAEGMALRPKLTVLAPGETLDVTLHFTRLDDSITSFHAIDEDDYKPWLFFNIQLQPP